MAILTLTQIEKIKMSEAKEAFVFEPSRAIEVIKSAVADNGHDQDVVGNPQTILHRYVNHPSGQLRAFVWECTAGSWTGPSCMAEIFTVIEGEATVSDSTGKEYRMKAGDCMYTPKGAKVHWKVDKYVKTTAAVMPELN